MSDSHEAMPNDEESRHAARVQQAINFIRRCINTPEDPANEPHAPEDDTRTNQ